MREILFRAKAINRDGGYHRTNYKNGDWVYGLISRLYDERFNFFPAEMTNEDGISGIEIDHNTIGQYTGLTDKNAKKIFEGDIVRTLAPCSIDKYIKGVVVFGEYSTSYQSSNVGYYVNWSLNKNLAIYCKINDIEIIGNIHDNPELLEDV